MRALLSEVKGPPSALCLRELETPLPEGDQVLVEVRAAGVNFPDLLMIEDLYQFRPPRPFAPGGEVAGVVIAAGPDAKQFKPGDRVIGYVGFGGFASHVLVPEERCYPLPDEVPFDVGASILYTYGTTWHALVERGSLRKGERLLVLGAAGGVGIAAVQLGHALGAHVIAAARGDERLEFCRAQGADEVLDYTREDMKTALKAKGGVDVVYDPVGGDFSDPALRSLRPGGRHLVIGFAAGEIPRIPLNLVLLKECEVIGVQWGAFALREPERHRAMLSTLLGMVKDHTLEPYIYKRYPLENGYEALEDMAARKVQGKAVIVP